MKKLLPLAAFLFLIVAFAWLTPQPSQHTPTLTSQQEHHILYGDSHGGGHLHGQNKDCKSEFPASWDAAKIIATVKAEAANDNLNWRAGKKGYHVAESNVENVRVRIVLNDDRTRIITAYPVNGPRNACRN